MSNTIFQNDLEEFRRNRTLKNKKITIALKNETIIGFGIIKWKKSKKTANFKGSALRESSSVFPFIVMQTSDVLSNQGISQVEWKRDKDNEFLFNSMKQMLTNTKPVSSKFNIERRGV